MFYLKWLLRFTAFGLMLIPFFLITGLVLVMICIIFSFISDRIF